MGTTLASRENSIVDTLLKVRSIRAILPEEDETGTRATKRLMGRGSDDIAILERVVQFLSSNEAASVGDISHERSTLLVCDLAEFGIFPVTGISRGTADDETRLENLGLRREAWVVNEVGIRGDSIRVGLEVDGRGSHLLLSGL